MKILHMAQGSPEWFEAHRGLPTASQFSRIMTPAKMQLSSKIDTYIAELIGQKLGGRSMMPEGYVSRPMRDGITMEPEARNWVEMELGTDLQQVGMMVTDDGKFGASPDALIPDRGILELKCPLPSTHVRYLMDAVLPAEYMAQVHGSLIVAEGTMDYVMFVSYCPPLPALVIRAEPNNYTERLADCMRQFDARYQSALARIVAMGPALEIKGAGLSPQSAIEGLSVQSTDAEYLAGSLAVNRRVEDALQAEIDRELASLGQIEAILSKGRS